ncbi:MAG: hypothetical protein JKY37_09240 [Nannocystaceae bacterium]|nr:hypothetical protein [Nannocystaceae bacterium]
MPGLRALLDDTMIFRAAKGVGIDLFDRVLAPGMHVAQGPMSPTETDNADEGVVSQNPVWSWRNNFSDPSVFTAGKVWKRMGGRYMPHMHTVFSSLQFSAPIVTTTAGKKIELPLSDKFHAATFLLDEGEVNSFGGFWQLPHATDTSILNIFGYELRDGSLVALSLDEMLGHRDDLMPWPLGDSARHAYAIATGTTVKIRLAPPRFLAFVGLTCCKERNDWEPGKLLGTVRLFPHTMVTSSLDLTAAEASVRLVRPPKSMVHDPEMQEDVTAILFADTNDDQWHVPGPPPLPLWDNIFDYYDVEPLRRLSGVPQKFVGRDLPERMIHGGVRRASRDTTWHTKLQAGVDAFYAEEKSFRKVAGQGAFDNIHLAPGMQFSHVENELVVDGRVAAIGKKNDFEDVVMAPFCVHDCLHMHTRWGKPFGPARADEIPKSNTGFVGYAPYEEVGAPMVPFDQDAFVTVESNHAFTYRGLAQGKHWGVGHIPRGTLQCFMHHGAGYAQDIWPETNLIVSHGEFDPQLSPGQKLAAARLGVHKFSGLLHEPWHNPTRGVLETFLWAAFYHRLRFGGVQLKGAPEVNLFLERLKVIDLDRCLR